MSSVFTIVPAAVVRGVTRRRFLTAGATLLVSGTIAHALPSSPRARRMAPEAFLPDMPSDDALRRLAFVAMDTARTAGADFADVRIGVQRYISIIGPWPPRVRVRVGYGMRVLVDGTWSFRHGNIFTPDAVTSIARSAVGEAKIHALTNTYLGQEGLVELAESPSAIGEWRTPMEIDPFTVPLDDYYLAFQSISDVSANIHRNTKIAGSGLAWSAETRVFASTENSLITQHFMRGGINVNGAASLPDNPNDIVSVDVPGVEFESGGFEVALRTDWVERLQVGMEEAIRVRQIPRRRFQEIGRFPIVLEGRAFATLMGQSVSVALDGDRVLGLDADASGGTFLGPPGAFLEAEMSTLSPLLTIKSDRALPSVMAVGWDDEGVIPQTATLVKEGRITDYHTTRASASRLAPWYQKQGKPIRSQGRSIAENPSSLPACSGGNVTVLPGTTMARSRDWERDILHGFVIREVHPSMDSKLSAGVLSAESVVLEIRKGKPVSRTYLNMQFRTKMLLTEKLQALGDATTVRAVSVEVNKGLPWQGISQRVVAPAAFFSDVDVFSWNTGG